MTIQELWEIFDRAWHASVNINDVTDYGNAERAGVTAIVRALRDEIVPDGEWWDHADVKGWFNEILGDAGEKVADAAPAVCVWTPYTDEPLGADWWRTCKDVRHRYKFDGHHPCASCGKPIKFTEAK